VFLLGFRGFLRGGKSIEGHKGNMGVFECMGALELRDLSFRGLEGFNGCVVVCLGKWV